MKKVVFIVLLLVLITSFIVMLSEKNRVNMVNKDINNYSHKIDELNNEINNFDIKKEQVKENVLSKIDEDKLKVYEVWEKENKKLLDALR